MRISFVFLLSLLLGAGAFAQSPETAKYKADSAAIMREMMLTEMKIKNVQTIRRLDQAYRESAAQAGVDTARKVKAEAPTMTTATGSEYATCGAPKPWFQISSRPTFRATGGFQLGYAYPIGYHLAIGAGVRCSVSKHFSCSALVKGNQLIAQDSSGNWLHRTRSIASVRGNLEYTGLFPNEPAKYYWQVSAYWEKFLFPGVISWNSLVVKEPTTLPVIVKHSLRLSDQTLGVQGKICFDAFNIGAFAQFFPRIEVAKDGQRFKGGAGVFVGFGL